MIINTNPNIPSLRKQDDKTKIDLRYMLISPFASVHIYWDEQAGELVYDLEEPLLDEQEKKQLQELEEAMSEMINVSVVENNTEEGLTDYIDKTARRLISELGLKVKEDTYEKIFYYLYRDFIGLNEIEPLMHDYFIEDIECNGVNQPVYIVHRVFRNMRTNIRYDDVDKLANFVEKLAQKSGKHISYASPLLDASLPDGSRINATYTKDVTSKGPTFTIRKFTKVPWTPIHLLGLHTLSPEMLAYFWLLLQYKSNILITGGTASGKTTLLNAIAFFIPPESRVVSIEDSVTGDSKIIIKQGSNIRQITIKEFVDNKIDAEVMSVDESGKIVFIKPSNYIKHKVKKDIYEVITGTGRKIKVTKDHSLFTLGDEGLEEIKPTALESGKSFIAVPRKLPIYGEEVNEINLMNHLNLFADDFLCGEPIKKVFEKYKLDELNVEKERYRWWKKHNIIKIKTLLDLDVDFTFNELKALCIKSKNKASIPVLFSITKKFLEFCGLWLGDGSYDNYNKNAVIVSNNDIECRDVVKSIAQYLNSDYSLMNDNETSIRIHNSIFYKFMKYVLKLDGHSISKTIPDFILNLSNRQIRDFIRGYFSADGGVKKSEISCASQSYELLQDMQTLLLRLNIITRINNFYRKDKCINLSISDNEYIERFKEIGFLQDRKNNKLALLNKKTHHTHSDVVPLTEDSMNKLRQISLEKLQHNYYSGKQRIGRKYLKKIAPCGSVFNDLSHNDVYWDRVKEVRKISSDEIEVFDLSIPGYEKFLCNNIFVHNTREINLPRENWLPSVVRSGVSGSGEVDMYALLRSSFRQNPDYVIVGEVRGKEAYVLFQGMASGHASISTIHADSVDTVINRLETPPINLNPALVNSLDAVAIMTHAIVKKQESRRLREVVEIVNVKSDGEAETNTPFVWNPSEDKFYFKKDKSVFQKIANRYGISLEDLEKEFENRSKLIYQLFKQGVKGFDDVQRVVNEYYRHPEVVLKKFGLM
ncbi:MAG: ATPase, T2SS/T4P/T4SS family [Candidatus Nanoarchaeia archaeon]